MDIHIGVRIGRKRIEAVVIKNSGEPELSEHVSLEYTNDKPLVDVLREIAQNFDDLSARWSLSLPSHEFSFRRLSFPFKNRRAIASAVPFELEGLLPYSSDSFVSKHEIVATSDDSATVMACAIRKERLDFYTDAIREAGIDPIILTPDVEPLAYLYRRFLRPDGPARPALMVDVDDTTMLICYTGEAGQLDYYSAEPDERELENFMAGCDEKPETVCIGGSEPYRISLAGHDESWKTRLRNSFSGSIEPERVVAPLALALLGSSGEKPSLDFIKEAEFYGKLRDGFKFIAVSVALFMILSIGFLFYRHQNQNQTLRDTKAEIGRVYKTAIPKGRMVKPNFQLKQRLKSVKSGLERAGFGESGRKDLLWILKLLAERLQAVQGAIIEEIIYEEKFVTIKGKAGNFNSVNRIRDLLDDAPAFKSVEVADSRTFPDTKKVSFKMKLQL